MKDVVMTQFKKNPATVLQEMRKETKNCVRLAGFQAEILSLDLLNTIRGSYSLGCYISFRQVE
jgi:hypothetical protein